jgi:hypothetical protein
MRRLLQAALGLDPALAGQRGVDAAKKKLGVTAAGTLRNQVRAVAFALGARPAAASPSAQYQ